jgi:hypothetical protein
MTRSMVTRRGLLTLAASSVCLPRVNFAFAKESPSRQESIGAWRHRVQSILERRRVPIIDLQATYVANWTNLSRMIGYMEELDVAQIAFAPAFQPNGQVSVDLHRKYPEYFIPTTNSGEFPRWWNDPLAFLAGVREDLKTGMYFFMGEHEFRHYPSPEQVEARQFHRDITVPLDGPAGHTLFQLSEEFGVGFQIHYDIEDVLLPPLETVLARYPKAQVIWCHLAMIRYPDRTKKYSPEYVRSLIERFPGLHFDLAVPPPWYVYPPSGHHDSTLFHWSGRITDDWLALLEKYPERFLSASDYRPPVEEKYVPYVSHIQRKLILGALSERARHLVAYGNAWRIITGEPWRG